MRPAHQLLMARLFLTGIVLFTALRPAAEHPDLLPLRHPVPDRLVTPGQVQDITFVPRGKGNGEIPVHEPDSHAIAALGNDAAAHRQIAEIPTRQTRPLSSLLLVTIVSASWL